MNYDIKIVGEEEDNGLLEFDRLNLLTKSTKEIATKALMLRLRGFSDIPPEKPLRRALALRLQSISGSKTEGTSLTIDCEYFDETIKGLQYELFKPSEEILSMTPMSLVIDTFHRALSSEIEHADVDKPLLKSLLSFKRNFISDNEIFYLANRGTVPEVKLTKDDFFKISHLEESIPAPRKVLLNGQLDEMKVSKGKLGLQTENGFVNVFANDQAIVHEILEFMGKEVTISGIANFKPNGQISYVRIQDFSPPNNSDRLFSKQPAAMFTRQQILFEIKKGKGVSSLENIVGQWPGDESDDEFNQILKDVK